MNQNDIKIDTDMNIRRIVLPVLSGLVLCSCSGHFISDRDYREEVLSDFSSRSELLAKAGIDLSSMELSTDEREALEFLYAYMPLGDMLNMDVSYWLENYRLTKKAAEAFPWGADVPEREMRHFVLPVRVNNENLDSSRAVFFRELLPRLEGLSMHDAVLEVNHWCHEKATYQPTDSRTCSPLTIVSTTYGRCGEESTFLVAALRSVGIPARQVYTPRWAHTDSNHAWVEAWVDGDWHFLGACEPEPVLDLGWFNAPASRGMLMHTKVFGRYDGPEEVLNVTPGYTEINVVENYAPDPARVEVSVVGTDGRPVPGARVEYRVYNYSELYPVTVKDADSEGKSSLTAGSGDMVVYATDGESFGMKEVSFGKDKDVTVVLDRKPGVPSGHISMELVPPAEKHVLPDVTKEQRDENTRRMVHEDSLRLQFASGFYTEETAEEFAASLGLPAGRTAPLLVASMGNHAMVADFLSGVVRAGRGDDALNLLESISRKDLQDTPCSVLMDHLASSAEGADPARVLSPRVSMELITPYRGYFVENIPSSLADTFRKDPAELVSWCRDNIALMDSISMASVYVAPVRVWETKVADRPSRDVFFVAVCRSLGVPAWMDPVTGTLKYEKGGKVYDVDFEAREQTVSPRGRLKLSYTRIPLLDDPKYYSNFTLSRWENGTFHLMSYPENATWNSVFREGTDIGCGFYMLVSGVRMADGSVLSDVEFFTVDEGRTVTVPLEVRDDASQIRVIGSFNSEALYDKVTSPGATFRTGGRGSVLSATGRGYFAVVLADRGLEPTNHALKDISRVASDFEAWGRPLLVIFASEDDCRHFDPSYFNLPSTVSYGIDSDGSLREMVAAEMKLSGKGRLPLVLVADTFNRVVFFSEGYSIGLGENIVKTVKAL